MKQWLLTAWHILMFRQGPQDLPGRSEWTALAALFYLVSGAGLLLLRGMGAQLPLMLAMDFVLIAAFIWLLLRAMGRGERSVQCLQAIWLCGSILHLISMPFAPVLTSPPEEPTLWLDVAVIMSLGLVFWSIALLGHILRHALEWPFARSLLLALAYTVFNIVSNYHVFSSNS